MKKRIRMYKVHVNNVEKQSETARCWMVCWNPIIPSGFVGTQKSRLDSIALILAIFAQGAALRMPHTSFLDPNLM